MSIKESLLGVTWQLNSNGLHSALSLSVVPFSTKITKPGVLGEITDSRAETRKVPDEPRTSYCAKRQEALTEWQEHVKGHKSQLDGTPTGQTGDNLGIKVHNNGSILKLLEKNKKSQRYIDINKWIHLKFDEV